MEDWADSMYKPKIFDEIVGNAWAISTLKRFVNETIAGRGFPHMILSGLSGVGKSCAIEVFCESINAEKKEWNASDDRKLEVIREGVKGFVSTKSLDARPKIAFLDEFDLTEKAQEALRRMMEKFSNNCKFMISTNFLYGIIRPIRSRCFLINFRPLTPDEIYGRLAFVREDQHITEVITEEQIFYIAQNADGDMRMALKNLQGLCIGRKEPIKNEEIMNVEIPIDRVNGMLRYALDGKYAESVEMFLDVATYGNQMDIFRAIESEFMKQNFTDKEKAIIGAGLGQLKGEYLLGDRKSMYGFLAFLSGV